jgi:hypothetical protein
MEARLCPLQPVMATWISAAHSSRNLAPTYGITPLLLASYSKYEAVVKWLIKNGANTQASSNFGTAANVAKDTAPRPSRPRTSTPGRTAPTPAAAARSSRSAVCAWRCGFVARSVRWRTGRRTRRSARRRLPGRRPPMRSECQCSHAIQNALRTRLMGALASRGLLRIAVSGSHPGAPLTQHPHTYSPVQSSFLLHLLA